MGLDSLWKVEDHPVFDPPLRLCGGMFSGHGEGSFRGKVYSELVEDITGVSLHREEIEPALVAMMSTALNATLYDPAWDEQYGVRPGEFADIQRMFSAYAGECASLHSWW